MLRLCRHLTIRHFCNRTRRAEELYARAVKECQRINKTMEELRRTVGHRLEGARNEMAAKRERYPWDTPATATHKRPAPKPTPSTAPTAKRAKIVSLPQPPPPDVASAKLETIGGPPRYETLPPKEMVERTKSTTCSDKCAMVTPPCDSDKKPQLCTTPSMSCDSGCGKKPECPKCPPPKPKCPKDDPCKKNDPCGSKKQECPKKPTCGGDDDGCGKKPKCGADPCKKPSKCNFGDCTDKPRCKNAICYMCGCDEACYVPKSTCKLIPCQDKCDFEKKRDIICDLCHIFDTTNCQDLSKYYGDTYRNKQFFMYHDATYYDLMTYMQNKRLSQPNARKNSQ